MNNIKGITIVGASDEVNKYIVKDPNGIVVGRFNIIDLDSENKNVLIKFKFFKGGSEGNSILQEAVKQILDNLIKGKGMHKINIICDERISLGAFQNLGFNLEGYIEDGVMIEFKFGGALLLGITSDVYYGSFYKKDVLIEGNHIDIKVLTSEDAEEVVDYYIRNRNFLSKYEPYREESFFTIEKQKKMLMDDYKEFLKDEGVHFGIYKDKKLIGRIRISNIIQGVFKSAFIGYSIDESEQGHGYMKEAVNLVVDYAYEELGLHRIEATTLVDNTRSQSVLIGCGFNELGICKDYLRINGKWRDHKIFYKNS